MKSLCQLVDTIESGTFQPSKEDDLSLAVRIQEELAAGEENKARKKLFGDARHLADHIIKRYLVLDQETRQKMADVYETEQMGSGNRLRAGAFQNIGGIRTGTRVKLKNYLNNSEINLLNHISNYSKIIPFLVRYSEFVEKLPKPTRKETLFPNFLLNIGQRALNNYNFCENRKYLVNDERHSAEVLTWGVPEELRKRVLDCESLVNYRTKRINEYCEWVRKLDVPLIKYSGLHRFFVERDEEWITRYDFRAMNLLRGRTRKSLIDSVTYGLPEELKESIVASASLLAPRIVFLEKYAIMLEDLKSPVGRKVKLTNMLATTNIQGESVDKKGEGSLSQWIQTDFASMCLCNVESESALYQRITSGIPSNLRKRLDDARVFTTQRVKIINNYVSYISNLPALDLLSISFRWYLNTHNINGDKVDNKDSLGYFARFRIVKGIADFNQKNTAENLTTHFVKGLSADLQKRLRDAISLLPIRQRVLLNYVDAVERGWAANLGATTLCLYLQCHDLEGNPAKPYSENNPSLYGLCRVLRQRKRGENNDFFLDTFVDGIDDLELVEKVRKYNAQTVNHAERIRKILTNYISAIESGWQTSGGSISLGRYMETHTLDGTEVPKSSSGVVVYYYNFNFAKNRRYRKGESRELIESLMAVVGNSPLIRKAAKYAS
jgi:hypothetical protein